MQIASIARRALALCCTLWVLSLSTVRALPQAVDDAATGWAAGAAYMRLLEDYLHPATCSIVLERQRCRDDRQILRSYIGDPNLDSAFDNWFVTGDVSEVPQGWNGMEDLDAVWNQRPESGFWYISGAVMEAASLPTSATFQSFSSSMVSTLWKHRTEAPIEFQPLLTGPNIDPRLTLLPAIEKNMPVSEFPQIRLSNGPMGIAQLGVYFGALMELIDVPIGLSRPESRLFAADLLRRVDALHLQYSDGKNSADLQAAFAGPIPASLEWIDTNLREPLSNDGPTSTWPRSQSAGFLLGMSVAQVAFNALSIKDVQADWSFRNRIPSLVSLASVSPEIKRDALLLASIPQGDLQDVGVAATRLTLEIVSQP